MRFDVDKLLQLDYLNSLISQINDEIAKLNSSFLEQYSLEKLIKMEKSDIESVFNHHKVERTNVIRYLESDFIDEGWEFADLFHDDILYSTELRAQIKLNALDEIEKLNNIINEINDNYRKEIVVLEYELHFINTIVKLLNSDDVFLEEDIDNVNNYIINSDFTEIEKFNFSYNFVLLLLDKGKDISLKKPEVDTAEFEKILDEAYSSTNYKEDDSDLEITEPVYSETILGYYKYYKKLFDEVGLGNNLSEVMNTSLDLATGVSTSVNSMTKEDFCVELGSLLAILNDAQKQIKVDQDLIADTLMDLAILDRLYEEDLKLTEYKDAFLNKIRNELSIIAAMNVDTIFNNKIRNRLNLLRIELNNNLINSKRLKEIDLDYIRIRTDMNKLSEVVNQLTKLNDLKTKIVSLLSKSYLVDVSIMADYYNNLTNLNSKVVELIDIIKENEYNPRYNIDIMEFEQEFIKYTMITKTTEEDSVKNIDIKGFVLFDFDENNIPYVLNDLDPNSSKNLIDDSVLQKKVVRIGFEDYNALINDLLIYGNPEIIKNGGVLPYMDRILTNVYYDKNRNNPSEMVRIRPLRNSLVRFTSQKIVLKVGTEIHQQVLNIIQESLPNVNVSLNKDFALYINFSSAIKLYDEDSYGVSINRYLRKSPLYKLFIENHGKTKLTDVECNLLRDMLRMTLDAYLELEKRNENLNFDIIRQIGGKKARGQ